jgi:hypothetical protein
MAPPTTTPTQTSKLSIPPWTTRCEPAAINPTHQAPCILLYFFVSPCT